MNPIIIAIVGSRKFPDLELVRKYVEHLYTENLGQKNYRVISGGALGVDITAELEAKKWKIFDKRFPADWDKYGKSAGYIRNHEMVKHAHEVVAFWDGESNGTKNTMDLTKKEKKPLTVFVRFNKS